MSFLRTNEADNSLTDLNVAGFIPAARPAESDWSDESPMGACSLNYAQTKAAYDEGIAIFREAVKAFEARVENEVLLYPLLKSR